MQIKTKQALKDDTIFSSYSGIWSPQSKTTRLPPIMPNKIKQTIPASHVKTKRVWEFILFLKNKNAGISINLKNMPNTNLVEIKFSRSFFNFNEPPNYTMKRFYLFLLMTGVVELKDFDPRRLLQISDSEEKKRLGDKAIFFVGELFDTKMVALGMNLQRNEFWSQDFFRKECWSKKRFRTYKGRGKKINYSTEKYRGSLEYHSAIEIIDFSSYWRKSGKWISDTSHLYQINTVLCQTKGMTPFGRDIMNELNRAFDLTPVAAQKQYEQIGAKVFNQYCPGISGIYPDEGRDNLRRFLDQNPNHNFFQRYA